MSASVVSPALSFRTSRLWAWLRLVMGAVLLWFFFAVVSPWLIAASSAWQHYGAVQEEQGLNSGALYYTDVPVSLDCENANRAAVARALELRRAKLADNAAGR